MVELYPHYGSGPGTGIVSPAGYERLFPAAFRHHRTTEEEKGIVKVMPGYDAGQRLPSGIAQQLFAGFVEPHKPEGLCVLDEDLNGNVINNRIEEGAFTLQGVFGLLPFGKVPGGRVNKFFYRILLRRPGQPPVATVLAPIAILEIDGGAAGDELLYFGQRGLYRRRDG